MSSVQLALQGDQLGLPSPKGQGCEWCSRPAVSSLPIFHRIKGKKTGTVPTGKHVYFCAAHQGAAERATAI